MKQARNLAAFCEGVMRKKIRRSAADEKRVSISTVGDFLREAESLREEWFPDHDVRPWFRGQTRAEWGLRPSLYRNCGTYDDILDGRTEDEIREEFIVRAPVFSDLKPAGDDDWEWYFLMQHYGAPTRLLDWTQGALLALYFAVKDNPGHFDSAVWALDPFALNERAIGLDEVIPPSAQGVAAKDRRIVSAWLPTRFTRRNIPQKPIAVFPTHIARRISTQRSCFTVHGRDYSGLEKLANIHPASLRKLIVPSFRVRAIKRQLIDSGIDEATIFPDLDGLGRAIGAEYTVVQEPCPDQNVVTRLQPSGVARGKIGVFAIKKIGKGDRPFVGESEEIVWLEKHLIARRRMQKAVRQLYDDHSLERGARLGCPVNFNRLTVSWYLQRASAKIKPNVSFDEFFEIRAIRAITPGEELVADFSIKH